MARIWTRSSNRSSPEHKSKTAGAVSKSFRQFCFQEALHKQPRDVTPKQQTHKATGKSKRALERLTRALQQRAHHNDATLPAVVLIQRQNVSRGEQKVQPAKRSAVSQQ